MMNCNHSLRFALSLAIATGLCYTLGSSAPALAQVPAQTEPGLLLPREERQLEEQRQLPKPQEETPQVDLNVPKQAPVVQVTGTQFQVNKINVESVTLLTDEELQPVLQQFEGRQLSLDDLEKLVEEINRLYYEKGYLTTQAYVPPQEVEQGTVTIKVVEGRVGELCVAGNRFYRGTALMRQIDLKEGEPFNLKKLENSLNRSNMQNNFRLKATLSPGDETGETNVRIDAAERQPWQITPTFDNQGRPFIGMYRGGVEVTNDSLFGRGDRLATKYVGAEGTHVALGSYYIPLNSNGDELGFNYGYSHVDVELPGTGQPEIIGRAHSYGMLFSHPFDDERVWVGDIGVVGRRIVTEIDDNRDPVDEIRALQAGLTFNRHDRLGRTFARVQNSVGLDILGGNAQFWKGETFITRLFRMPLNNILILRFYGQYSPDVLPSAESFQIGGAYSVRGYTEGLITGDRGYNFSIEDRFPIPFLRHLSPWLADRMQGAVFYDIGQAWVDEESPRFLGDDSDLTLLSGAGVGLRARLTQYLQGFIDFGFGLNDRDDLEPLGVQPTARIHFGVRSNLLPERFVERPGDCVRPGQAQSGSNSSGPTAPTNIKSCDFPITPAEKPTVVPAANVAPEKAAPLQTSVLPPLPALPPKNEPVRLAHTFEVDTTDESPEYVSIFK